MSLRSVFLFFDVFSDFLEIRSFSRLLGLCLFSDVFAFCGGGGVFCRPRKCVAHAGLESRSGLGGGGSCWLAAFGRGWFRFALSGIGYGCLWRALVGSGCLELLTAKGGALPQCRTSRLSLEGVLAPGLWRPTNVLVVHGPKTIVV